MMPVLLDTGVIVALLDRSERHHKSSVAAVEEIEQPMVTCEAVIAESCYLLRRFRGASEAILENINQRMFQIPFQITASAIGVAAIMRKYSDLEIDFADACLIQMADDLGTGDILTLDRHFRSYRWRKTHPFRMIVPLE